MINFFDSTLEEEKPNKTSKARPWKVKLYLQNQTSPSTRVTKVSTDFIRHFLTSLFPVIKRQLTLCVQKYF